MAKFDLYNISGSPWKAAETDATTTSQVKGDHYIPSPELQAAVRVALVLQQPLLLTGEPGTGKTELAYYLARQFKTQVGPYVFNAQTVSTKKDLFYQYDALGHFQYAHASSQREEAPKAEKIEERFVRYQGLGAAIRTAVLDAQPSVVLIDEIDKAPRDLPNDLLVALEDLSFEVPEIPGATLKKWECPQKLKPFIVITSNSEKNLPDAFLRRVVYHHIEFPDGPALLEILKSKELVFSAKTDLHPLVDHFTSVRGKGLLKKPATAELIAWAALLSKLSFPVDKLKFDAKRTLKQERMLRVSYAALAKTREDLAKLRTDG